MGKSFVYVIMAAAAVMSVLSLSSCEEEKSELVRLLNRLYLNVRNGGLERG